MNKLSTKRILSIAWPLAIAMFFIADRLLKSLALERSEGPAINLIGRYFSFQLTRNPYIAFSLPLGGKWLLGLILGVILALIFYIIYLIIDKRGQKPLILPLTFILFGAINNMLDRINYGYVIDYLELRHFSSFNLADVMISLGAIGTIICYLNSQRSKPE